MKRGNTKRRKIKTLAVSSVAVFVTGGLFLTMSGLVANDDTQIPVWAEPPVYIDVVQVPNEPKPPIKTTFVDKPDEVIDPPELDPDPTPPKPCVEPCWGNHEIPPKPPSPDSTIGFNPTQSDGDMMVIAAFPPQYPQTPANRGIEGYVIISLTVTADGQVADPYVMEAEPAGVFNRAALKAISKFKYKPRVVDGKALPVSNVRYKMTFELKD